VNANFIAIGIKNECSAANGTLKGFPQKSHIVSFEMSDGLVKIRNFQSKNWTIT